MPHPFVDKILPILSAVSFEAQVRNIAVRIFCGMICYLNMDTLEIEECPQNSEMDFWEDDNERGEGDEEAPKYLQWKKVLSFEPLPSSASFNSYIHNSTFKEAWFAFKDNAYEQHVRKIIFATLNVQE